MFKKIIVALALGLASVASAQRLGECYDSTEWMTSDAKEKGCEYFAKKDKRCKVKKVDEQGLHSIGACPYMPVVRQPRASVLFVRRVLGREFVNRRSRRN